MSSGEAPVIEARGVSKGYQSGGRTLQVLRDVDFEIRPREIIAIVGASGIGKSTLLHILGGIDRPDTGRVLHRGQDLSRLDDKGYARFRNERVGFVFQFHYLLPEFTALENVMMPRLIRGERQSTAAPRAAELLAEMGLSDRASHRPGALSGGEQQRVAIARALASDPELVIADEPTGNLDTATGEQVFRAFASRVVERGLCAVLATHNDALARQCHKVMRIVEGRLVEARSYRPSPKFGGQGADE